ncbi:hypothetical protein XVE_1671 [Xanthomonas vesicatoria ATCC 35937]|uniref:Uncharacterized protein n=1 Tax=Xanthomonas vesicatoria ATCC 35937 TaxID=925775 RepID=F0BC46_9XANT|nr:hypothetical protein XVE_1671 [Xanthomonas vesicatoria ATCC 35937]
MAVPAIVRVAVPGLGSIACMEWIAQDQNFAVIVGGKHGVCRDAAIAFPRALSGQERPARKCQ